MLKLMYITNSSVMAKIADAAGVDRIWIDLEKKDKEDRQRGLNAVISDHKVDDVARIRPILKKAELLVRVNHWGEWSLNEIDEVICKGADIIMLPYYKSIQEVEDFISRVGGRAKTVLLLETKEAVCILDETLLVPGIDEIHIGLRDLQLSLRDDFMFESVANGLVNRICKKIQIAGKPYGFGGVARLGEGLVSAEMVLSEHYRLGSTRAILSRSFCNLRGSVDWEKVERQFNKDLRDLRAYERILSKREACVLDESHEAFKRLVGEVAAEMRRGKCVNNVE